MRDFLTAVSLLEATQLFPTIIPHESEFFVGLCADFISVVLTP
jgi:hypothetical protein